MAEPFKNELGEGPIRAMTPHLVRSYPEFDSQGFVDFALENLDELELKQRSMRITEALQRFLPDDFLTAAKILAESLAPNTNAAISELAVEDTTSGIMGWPVMSMSLYVALYGQDHPEVSLELLKEMTTRFSSEFAIRYFLLEHDQLTLNTLQGWIANDDEHVRRLVSEGTRPRLPWAMQLPPFIAEPSPVIALLEQLKDDPSEYVRRSVANNLNDIAKDHPDLVAEIAARWMQDASQERAGLIRHALRTLIKAGHPGALETLGYGPPQIILNSFEVLSPEVTLGEALEFTIEITSACEAEQSLMIDYVVHHMRANGQTTAKVFKWKKNSLKGGGSLTATRRHAMKPITTRRYYPGQHRIELQINGETFGGAGFVLHTE